MPSSATLTTFYSFSPNTKARASQVNTNFSAFRGHLISVDPNTQTSTDLTYDVGSSEHRWRDIYGRDLHNRSVNLTTNTTTGNALALFGNTASSDPGFVFNISGSETLSIKRDRLGITSSAGIGQIGKANLAYTTGPVSAVTATVSNSTITIATIGRPVDLFIMPQNISNGRGALTLAKSQTATSYQIRLNLLRDGATVGGMDFGVTGAQNTSTGALIVPPSSVRFLDVPGAGTFNYSLQIEFDGNTQIQMSNICWYAIERRI